MKYKFSVNTFTLVLKNSFLIYSFSAFVILQNYSSFAFAQDTNPLQVSQIKFPSDIVVGESKSFEVTVDLPTEYHAYLDRLKFSSTNDNLKVALNKANPVVDFFDIIDKKNKKGITGKTTVSGYFEFLTLPESNQNFIYIHYQACSKEFCLLPKKVKIDFTIDFKDAEGNKIKLANKSSQVSSQTAQVDSNKMAFSVEQLLKMDFTMVMQFGLFWAFVVVFIGGVLTSLTPCIFPMIPITLAVLGRGSSTRSRTKNFILSLSYVFGIAITYASLGVVAASTGALFGSALQNTYVIFCVSLIFFIMSLSMYGFYDLQAPEFIRNYFNTHQTKGGYFGAFTTGIISGIVASPCVGPVLVGILTFVAQSQNLALGFTLLFVYALGLGMLFLVLGLTQNVSKLLPKSGSWMNLVKFFFGTIMLATSLYYFSLIIPERWMLGLIGVVIIALASFSGAFIPNENLLGFKYLQKGLMQAIFYIGILMVGYSLFETKIKASNIYSGPVELKKNQNLSWQSYSEELLQQSAKNNQAVLIDFWADWCAACHELEEKTFSNPEVEALMKKIVLIKVDNTKENEDNKKLIEKYKVVGLPTLIMIDQTGQVKNDLTLTAFEEAKLFKQRLEKLLAN